MIEHDQVVCRICCSNPIGLAEKMCQSCADEVNKDRHPFDEQGTALLMVDVVDEVCRAIGARPSVEQHQLAQQQVHRLMLMAQRMTSEWAARRERAQLRLIPTSDASHDGELASEDHASSAHLLPQA